MEENSVLVTGANSFVGKEVVHALVNAGVNVIAAYRNNDLELNLMQSKHINLHLCKLDLINTSTYSALPRFVNTIIHIAGISNWNNPKEQDMLMTNICGTNNIYQYAVKARVRKIIYTSSVSIHGEVKKNILDENTKIKNPSIYGISKFVGESILENGSRELSAVSIRLPGVVGDGSHGIWLSKIAENLLKNSNITIYGENNAFNNAIHVKDLANFIKSLAIGKDWEGHHAFPIGALNSITIAELLQRMKAGLNSYSSISYLNSTKSNFIISSNMAVSRFGYLPSSIEKIVDCYIEDIVNRLSC